MDDIARFIEAAITLRIDAEQGKAIGDFFRLVYDVPRKPTKRGADLCRVIHKPRKQKKHSKRPESFLKRTTRYRSWKRTMTATQWRRVCAVCGTKFTMGWRSFMPGTETASEA